MVSFRQDGTLTTSGLLLVKSDRHHWNVVTPRDCDVGIDYRISRYEEAELCVSHCGCLM